MAIIKEMGGLVLTGMMISALLICIIIYEVPLVVLILSLIGIASILLTTLFVHLFNKCAEETGGGGVGMVAPNITAMMISALIIFVAIFGTPLMVFIVSIGGILSMLFATLFVYWVDEYAKKITKERVDRDEEKPATDKVTIAGPILTAIVISGLFVCVTIFGTPIMVLTFSMVYICFGSIAILFILWSSRDEEKRAREELARIRQERKDRLQYDSY